MLGMVIEGGFEIRVAHDVCLHDLSHFFQHESFHSVKFEETVLDAFAFIGIESWVGIISDALFETSGIDSG